MTVFGAKALEDGRSETRFTNCRLALVSVLGRTDGLSTPGTLFAGRLKIWPSGPRNVVPRANLRFRMPSKSGPPGHGLLILISARWWMFSRCKAVSVTVFVTGL